MYKPIYKVNTQLQACNYKLDYYVQYTIANYKMNAQLLACNWRFTIWTTMYNAQANFTYFFILAIMTTHYQNGGQRQTVYIIIFSILFFKQKHFNLSGLNNIKRIIESGTTSHLCFVFWFEQWFWDALVPLERNVHSDETK